MIRATELDGRAVIDIDSAEKIGTIDKLILDPDGQQVAGFVIAKAGSGFPGTRDHVLLPSSAVHAVGPDAVTIRQANVAAADTSRLEGLPKGTDVIGRKVVSDDGRFLGKIGDVLVDGADGHIAGYVLTDHTPGKKWEALTEGDRKRRYVPYLVADTKLRTGRDLIVASEDTVNYDWNGQDDRLASAPLRATNSTWKRASVAEGDARPTTPGQPWAREGGTNP